MQKLRAFLLMALCVTWAMAASGAEIHGVVTDNAGKPVRGAMVKATLGEKSVTRFTQADGRYEIALPPGSYDLTVDAYGFNSKRQKSRDASQAGETNFTLTPGFSVARLTSAELQSLLPDNEQVRFIRGSCTICHSFGHIQLKSGYTAAEWAAFIPTMTAGRLASPVFTPAGLTAVTQALEKYFGPDAPYLSPDADPPKPQQVQHADLSDAVLNATIHEYAIPGGLISMPHSILVDKQDDAWFSGRLVGRFEAGPEKFDEYPVRGSHTGVVGKDGLVWMTVPHLGLASVDPKTGKVATYSSPNLKAPVAPVSFQASIVGTHTPAIDLEGNIWCSGSSVWKFDVKTKQYKEYTIPLPATAPKNSVEHWDQVPGEPSRMVTEGTFYDIKVDSKDKVWVSAFSMDELIRLDPVTGQTKAFPAPDSPSIRGIEIDAQDNVWFASYDGNSLGELDPSTGTFKLFHPPTRYAMPYGIVADKKTGVIWFSDLNGNHLTRFNPTTGEFAEFPIPSAESGTRFIDLDSKGRVWFTEWMNGKIGFLDPGSPAR
jgi:streptogramin lyase